METMGIVYLSVFLPFLLCLLNRPPSVESQRSAATGEPPGRTTHHCHRHMAHHIETCLERFQQKYNRYTHENTTDAEKTRTVKFLCSEYERTLMCLHYLLKSCPPNQRHMETVQHRVQLVHSFMQKLCFSVQKTSSMRTSVPTTVLSTSSQPSTTSQRPSTVEVSTSPSSVSQSTTQHLPGKSVDTFPSTGRTKMLTFTLHSTLKSSSAIVTFKTPTTVSDGKYKVQTEQHYRQLTGNETVKKYASKSKKSHTEHRGKYKDQVTLHVDINAATCCYCSLFITVITSLLLTGYFTLL